MTKPRGGSFWIFAVLFVAYAYFYQGGGWNQNTRFDLIRALVDDGAVTIDRYVANTDDRADCGAHACSDKAPGLALLATPVVAAATLVTDGVVARSYVATVVTSGLATALAGALLFGIALRLGASRRGAATIALAFGLGTPMWCYATLLTGHALAVSLLVATLAAALALRDVSLEHRRRARWFAVLVGLASGWTTITEFPSAVPAAVLALFALGGVAVRGNRRARGERALFVAAGGAVAAIALALYNRAAFGTIWHLGYQDVSRFPGMKRGLFGIGVPDLGVLVKVLFGHYRGLWFFAPVLALGGVGLALMVRRRETRALGVMLALLAAYSLLLDASYVYWDGGSSYGPRHTAPAIAWLAIGLVPLWTSGARARAAIVVLGAIGACCAAIAVTTDAQPIINEHHPMANILWPAFSSGRFAINTQSFEQLRPGKEIVAWNLGQLAGLGGWWSLVPLVVAWAAVGTRVAVRAAWVPRVDVRAIGRRARAWWVRVAWWAAPVIVVAAVAAVATCAMVAVAPAVRGDVKFQLDSFANLHFPAWDPYDRLGSPFYADPRPGTLYPVQWLVLAIGAVVDDAPQWLVTLKAALHLAIAGLGMYALARGRGLRAGAAYAGAVVAIASAPLAIATGEATGWSIAWLPWILVAVDRWAARPTAPRALAIAAAIAACVLAGDPVACACCALVIVPWVGAAVVRERCAPRLLVALALIVPIVGLLVAAQLAAYVDVLPEMASGATPSAALAHLGWLGAGVAVLGAVCLACARGPQLRTLELAGAVAACAALGVTVDVRFLAVGAVPLGVLAAEGFARCLDPSGPGDRRAWVLRAIVVGGALAVVASAILVGIASAVVGALAVGAIGALAWRPGARVQALAIALLAIDLAIAGAAAAPPSPSPGASPTKIAAQPGVPLVYRIYDRDPADARVGSRLRVRDLGGDEDTAFATARYAALHRAIAEVPRRMAYANVAYFADTPHLAARLATAPDAATHALYWEARDQLWSVVRPAQAVTWFDSARVVADEPMALATLFEAPAGQTVTAEAHAFATPAALERASRIETPARPVANGRLTYLDTDAVVAKVTAPGDGLVAITELYWPRGWSATVDDKPAEIVPVDGFARGVFVGAGEHEIAMTFEPPWWYQVGLWVALVVWLVLMMAAWVFR